MIYHFEKLWKRVVAHYFNYVKAKHCAVTFCFHIAVES
jgi:hypothetical protein